MRTLHLEQWLTKKTLTMKHQDKSPKTATRRTGCPTCTTPNEKTDLGDILDQDQQNAQRRVTMADNAHLQVRNREAHHVVGDDAVHIVTKYETTFEEAMQQTVTMDAEIELTHHMAEYDVMHMVTKYETNLEEEESVDTYKNNADSTHQQDVTKAYERMAAVSTTDDAQHQLMHGQSIPRAFFMAKALPEAKEETKRGLQFLHISNNMPRQSGTIAVARRPPMPDATPKKKEGQPKVQGTLCQEDRRDEAYDEEFATLARYDKESAAATLANYIDAPETHHDAGMHAGNTYKEETIYDEELIATDTLATNDEEFVAVASYDEEVATATLTTYDEETAAVEGEPWGA
jgi:hypothetical protein